MTEKQREYHHKYHVTHREARLLQNRNWRLANRDKRREYRREYNASHREQHLKQHLKWLSNPVNRLVHNYRVRLRLALKNRAKSARTLGLLQMDLKEFRIYIQGQFRPGMTWENYGPVWHIDHVRPCVSFDLTSPAQQQACFNWSNLQPLFAEENIRKGAQFVSVVSAQESSR